MTNIELLARVQTFTGDDPSAPKFSPEITAGFVDEAIRAARQRPDFKWGADGVFIVGDCDPVAMEDEFLLCPLAEDAVVYYVAHLCFMSEAGAIRDPEKAAYYLGKFNAIVHPKGM